MNTYELYDTYLERIKQAESNYYHLNNHKRMRTSDLELHNAQLLAACDSVDKLNYVNGVISLHEYLLRETRHTKRLNGIAKSFDNSRNKM